MYGISCLWTQFMTHPLSTPDHTDRSSGQGQFRRDDTVKMTTSERMFRWPLA